MAPGSPRGQFSIRISQARPRSPSLLSGTRASGPPLGLEDRINGEGLEAIPFDHPVALDSFLLHAELLHHAPGSRIAEKVARFDPMQAENRESKVDESPARLGRITAIPAIERDPVSQLGTPVLALDHERDGADERAGFPADDRVGSTGAIIPGGTMKANPLGCATVRIRVGNIERSVGDLSHAGEALDVESIERHERT